MSKNTNKTNPVEFNVGDRVKLVKKVTTRTPDFQNTRVEDMSDKIGSTFTIRIINRSGIYFEEEHLGYPPASLVKVGFSNFDELIKYMKRGGYVINKWANSYFLCYRIKKGVLEINDPDLSVRWERSLYSITDIQKGGVDNVSSFIKWKYL